MIAKPPIGYTTSHLGSTKMSLVCPAQASPAAQATARACAQGLRLRLRLLPNFARAPCSCSKSRLPNQDSACQGSIRGVCPSSLPLHPHTLTEQPPHVYIRLSSHLFCPSLIPLSSHHPTCSPNTPVTSALTTNHPPTRNPSHPQITNTPPPPKEWICSKDWPKRQSRLPAAVITTTPPQLAPKAPAIRLLVDKRITSTKVCHVSPQIKINTNTITQPDPI